MDNRTLELGFYTINETAVNMCVNTLSTIYCNFLGYQKYDKLPEESSKLFIELIGYTYFIIIKLATYKINYEAGIDISNLIESIPGYSDYLLNRHLIIKAYKTKDESLNITNSFNHIGEYAIDRFVNTNPDISPAKHIIKSIILLYLDKINCLMNEHYSGMVKKNCYIDTVLLIDFFDWVKGISSVSLHLNNYTKLPPHSSQLIEGYEKEEHGFSQAILFNYNKSFFKKKLTHFNFLLFKTRPEDEYVDEIFNDLKEMYTDFFYSPTSEEKGIFSQHCVWKLKEKEIHMGCRLLKDGFDFESFPLGIMCVNPKYKIQVFF